jgi:hypothetical protein
MSRGAHSFKQRDVTRAINAAKAAGIAIGRVEVDKDGKITIVAGQPGMTGTATTNDLDIWIAKHADAP